MTTLATRAREIADLEDFDVQIFRDGKPVDPKTNGLPKYGFEKKAKGAMTVEEWRTKRFAPTYPGYECEVLYADGKQANGNAKLETVRATYEAEE